MQRYLDCAVINHIHSINKRDKRKPFETVRCIHLNLWQGLGVLTKVSTLIVTEVW